MEKATKELIAMYRRIGMNRWADELEASLPRSTFVEKRGEFAVYRSDVL